MRARTAVALATVLGLLAGVVVIGLGFASGGTGTLDERWVSDTPRDNEVNHHAVGVGPEADVIVAPVAAVPRKGVTLSDTDCALVRLDPADGNVLWQDGLPADTCFTHSLTAPAIGDLDGDGVLEVATGTAEDALVVADARDGSEVFRVPFSTYGYSRPTIANVTAAPGKEIVASDIAGNVVLVHSNGTVAWNRSLGDAFDGTSPVWAPQVVADVDADGEPEIAVGTADGPVVLSGTGGIEWTGSSGAATFAVGQGDRDPGRELYTAEGGDVRAIDGATHAREWERSFDQIVRVRTVADAGGDGTATLLVGLANGTVVALDAATGRTAWSTTITADEDGVVAAPVVANVDGEGIHEVVAVARDGTVAVLDASDGSERAAYERPVPIWTTPTPADLDDDGADEILVRYGDGRIVALAWSS